MKTNYLLTILAISLILFTSCRLDIPQNSNTITINESIPKSIIKSSFDRIKGSDGFFQSNLRLKGIIVVDNLTYSTLKIQIDRFAEDISFDLGYKIEILVGNFTDAFELKKALVLEKQKSGDFRGLIFVGDLPWQYSVIKGEGNEIRPDDTWIADLEDISGYDVVNKHYCTFYGNCIEKYILLYSNKDIKRWTGRIYPTMGRSNRMELLKNFFDRDHAYRIGEIGYEGVLIYTPDDSLVHCNSYQECYSSVLNQYVNDYKFTDQANLNIIMPTKGTKATYLAKQKNRNVFQIINAHGEPQSFITGDDAVKYEDLVNNPPGALYSNFLSCSIGSFDAPNNLASGYIFEGEGLAAHAYTIPIFTQSPYSDSNFDPGAFLLGMGSNIMEAYPTRNHFEEILGDPTIPIIRKEGSCILGFNETLIDFGNQTMENMGFNTPFWRSFKVKNFGTKNCIVSDIELSGQVRNQNWPFNVSLYPFRIIAPGNYTEVQLKLGISVPEWDSSGNFIHSEGNISIYSNAYGGIAKLPFKTDISKIIN